VQRNSTSLQALGPGVGPLTLPAEITGGPGGLGGVFLAVAPYLPAESHLLHGLELELILRRESLSDERRSWILDRVGGALKTLHDLSGEESALPFRIVSSLATRIDRAGRTLFVGPWLFPTEDADRTGELEVARAVASHYFGEKLAVAGPGSYWTSGMARYAACLAADGWGRAGRDQLRSSRIIYFQVKGQPLDVPLAATRETQTEITLHKGSLVLRTLHLLLGDEVFPAALAAAFRKAQAGPLTLPELRSALERGSGRDLGAFFDQWVEGRGIPVARVERREGAFFVLNDGPGQIVFETLPEAGEEVRIHVLEAGESTRIPAAPGADPRALIDPEKLALVDWRLAPG
jgi:hypothetical protein